MTSNPNIHENPAPGVSESPAVIPGSPISAPPPETERGEKSAATGVPADVTNLALGAGLLLSAFLIFWMGLYLAHHVALRTAVASFGTFALVWVLYRLRIFQKPHGGLIAAGSIALFAATLPFIERGWQKLDGAARTGLAAETTKPPAEPAPGLPVPTQQNNPGLPPPAALPPPEEEAIRELSAPAPDPTAGKIISVIQDAKVTIHGHPFLLRAGSQYPYRKFADGKVTFQAGDQEVTIDSELVSFTGKSKETPAEITRLAGAEAMRRYPALRDIQSEENRLYVDRVNALKSEMPEIMQDPNWPLIVAEKVASQEGWRRADLPADEGAPALPELPEGALKIPPPAVPLPSPDVPQEAPPPAR